MRYKVLWAVAFAVLVALVAPYGGASADSVPPSENWNDSAGFLSPSERAARLLGVEMQEKKDGGFYDQWKVYNNNTYTGAITNCVNSGTGSQTSTETTQTSDASGATSNQGVDINAPADNTGDVAAIQLCNGDVNGPVTGTGGN